MLHNLLRSTAVLSVILASNAIGIGPANQTRADEPRRLFARRAARAEMVEAQPVQYGQPGLFHNHYVPAGSGQFATQLYVAPLSVPTNVGHTYYTYQPLLPHELLYDHQRSYHRYSNGGRGFNRTSVKWYSPPMAGILDFMRQKLTRAR